MRAIYNFRPSWLCQNDKNGVCEVWWIKFPLFISLFSFTYMDRRPIVTVFLNLWWWCRIDTSTVVILLWLFKNNVLFSMVLASSFKQHCHCSYTSNMWNGEIILLLNEQCVQWQWWCILSITTNAVEIATEWKAVNCEFFWAAI